MSFSSKERDQELCRNIIEAQNYIERYLSGVSKGEFLADPKTQDAVAMRLQQVLESAIKISTDSKKDLKISWSAMVAMRNKISHSYVDVDSEIVWDVLSEFQEYKILINWARARV